MKGVVQSVALPSLGFCFLSFSGRFLSTTSCPNPRPPPGLARRRWRGSFISPSATRIRFIPSRIWSCRVSLQGKASVARVRRLLSHLALALRADGELFARRASILLPSSVNRPQRREIRSPPSSRGASRLLAIWVKNAPRSAFTSRPRLRRVFLPIVLARSAFLESPRRRRAFARRSKLSGRRIFY